MGREDDLSKERKGGSRREEARVVAPRTRRGGQDDGFAKEGKRGECSGMGNVCERKRIYIILSNPKTSLTQQT